MLDVSFSLPPKEALAALRAKGYTTSWAWQDVWKQEHQAAFTVAKMTDVDLLRDVRAALDKSIAEGQTLAQFREELEPKLQQAGWWGVKEAADPLTGAVSQVQLGSPRRLRVIFETNLKVSHAAGDWAEIQDTQDSAPFLMYDAVDDEATRPEHAAWDGTVLPVDDPWWSTHFPPNGWGCRCSVIQLSGRQAAKHGYQEGDKAPPTKTREWTNPRTGEVSQVPVGIDPGWDYNVGQAAGNVQQQLAEKIAAFKADQ